MSVVTQEQPSARGSLFYDPMFRSIAVQVLLVLAIGWFIWEIAQNTATNLASRNIASGFGFLGSTAGFGVSR
jgi:general L-amino acid transport system permease protein